MLHYAEAAQQLHDIDHPLAIISILTAISALESKNRIFDKVTVSESEAPSR